ncbi:hypothetical protein [Sedimentitalea sp.]|uniref:hypothetical protein n=1 Tax=Sedimentitalea sp. TaxID=2048915 RepID=UPI0032969F71
MRAGEVVRLKVGDIDSAQQIIRIVQAWGLKDRNVMPPADILGLLRDWWKERPTSQHKDVSASERVFFLRLSRQALVCPADIAAV